MMLMMFVTFMMLIIHLMMMSMLMFRISAHFTSHLNLTLCILIPGSVRYHRSIFHNAQTDCLVKNNAAHFGSVYKQFSSKIIIPDRMQAFARASKRK